MWHQWLQHCEFTKTSYNVSDLKNHCTQNIETSPMLKKCMLMGLSRKTIPGYFSANQGTF